jgi:hypothetical protein
MVLSLGHSVHPTSYHLIYYSSGTLGRFVPPLSTTLSELSGRIPAAAATVTPYKLLTGLETRYT